MKLSLSDSPTKLAVLAALGGPVACGLPLLVPALNHSWLFGPYMLFCIVAAGVGSILPFKFVIDLRHGIEDERWTEAQLEPLRALFQSRYYAALSVGLFVAFLFVQFSLKQDSLGLGWAGLGFVEIILSQLHLALKRPPSPTPPDQWHHSGPINSEHRGKR